MKTQPHLPLPAVTALHKMGSEIRDARRRRRITIKLLAERAGVSEKVIGKIERGDPTTSMGGYAAVLFVLGMTERLANVADPSHDLTGRELDAEKLPQRVRLPYGKRKQGTNERQ